jgi:HSP20 family protein
MADNVTRYQPQTTVTRLPDLVDRLFRESFVMPSMFDRSFNGGSRPMLPVNLFETSDTLVFHASIPGVKPESLDIQVVGRELTIKGKFESNPPENGTWIWQGIPTGEFYENYALPVEVEGANVQASYDYGILSLVLPKAEHVRPKSIKVNVTK